jgi:hypothetical protein
MSSSQSLSKQPSRLKIKSSILEKNNVHKKIGVTSKVVGQTTSSTKVLKPVKTPTPNIHDKPAISQRKQQTKLMPA